jgi:thiamine biosynthesis protein ThiC
MTTIRLGAARVLLSSWEVTAFVSKDGPSAEDLRRAVVARALVAAATESTRETGNATNLDRALAVARVEVTRLLECVDAAKQSKDTEAAVNLGISAKRLNSAIDEADKL